MAYDDTLKVYYPHGGRRFLLHWWTYNDRGHVVLATTRASFDTVVKRVIDQNSDAEIKAMCEIEIVGPSKSLSTLAAEHRFRERVNHLYTEVSYRMGKALKAGLPIPKPFEQCLEYAPEEALEESDQESDQWARENHYSCIHCRDRIKLTGTTPVDLYMRHHERWFEIHPRKSYVDPKRVISRAVPAEDGSPLWYAHADFGHHSSGVDLAQVPDSTSEYQPAYLTPLHLSDRVMFFFRRLRELDSSPLVATLAARKADDEAAREEHNKQETIRREREDHEEIRAIIDFFTESI